MRCSAGELKLPRAPFHCSEVSGCESRTPLDQGQSLGGKDAAIASHLVGAAFDGVGLSGLEPLTSALSGEVMGVARPPPARRGRPGRSGLIHGAVGPVLSRTTSRQPVVTIELTVSIHPGQP
jgi:hypothetical protein